MLPDHRGKAVRGEVEATLRETEERFGVTCTLEVIQEDSSPPTREDAPVVAQLRKAILAVRGLKARAVGIGGGTVAAPFRKAGFDAAVWETVDGTGHTTDECIRIENLVADAKVFATMMLG
jgi:succinyl-diaminopimelate desuccinylase